MSGETVRIELADAITVELGTEGRVIQERTIAGRVRQIRIALLEVVRIEQALDGPWVAVGRITRSELAPAAGNGVEFTSVQPRQATLVIQSDPEGATAYIDGTQVGTTPTRTKVTPGSRRLRVENECYQPATRDVRISAGQQREITVNLAAQPTRGERFGPQQVITTAANGASRSTRRTSMGTATPTCSPRPRDDKIAWYENEGGGTFGPQQVITRRPTGPGRSTRRTSMGTATQDVLSASSRDDKIAWYENEGGGQFGPQQVITRQAFGARSVYAADLDGDGDQDVLSASVVTTRLRGMRTRGAAVWPPAGDHEAADGPDRSMRRTSMGTATKTCSPRRKMTTRLRGMRTRGAGSLAPSR